MNDKIIMENYLLILKSTVEVFVHGTLESSNEDVRNLLKESLNETLTNQANTYDFMVERNWYKKENIMPSQISEKVNKIKQNS